ncbi:MAG: alpha/beta fold hydrolase [Candidatus Alcyoniella australis]|nr:alpha/beta fold hydrolase [Candidatus Alcyoniella australis]
MDAILQAQSAARKVGSGLRGVLAKVNPDVWRELACVSSMAYTLVIPKRERVIARDDDGRTPVVLVHGMGGNRGTWTMLRAFLRLTGHRRIYAMGYEDGSVEELAERLTEFVESVREVTGEDQVDVVAHSLGGLITRYAIQRLGMDGHVRKLITLATPHQGSYTAEYADTVQTRQLRPGNPLLKDLNSDDWSRYSTPLICICSDRDVYVVPNELMRHPQGENLFVPNLAHTQYLISPAVFRLVAQSLAQ